MPWNVLIFPLLGGFVGLDWCFFTKLRNQRIEGNRLLLEAAFLGVWLAISAYLIIWFCESFSIACWIEDWWSVVGPHEFPYLGTGLVAMSIGPSIALLVYRIFDRDFAKQKAIEKAGDYILSALYEAASRFELVQVILDTNKVYVALVSVAPDLRPENNVILLPVLEGSRDKDTLDVQYLEKRTDWIYAWPTSERRWAEVIVPLNSIKTVNRVRSLEDLKVNPSTAGVGA